MHPEYEKHIEAQAFHRKKELFNSSHPLTTDEQLELHALMRKRFSYKIEIETILSDALRS